MYVGQTGRTFYIRFNEQLQSFTTYNRDSKFAQHLCEYGYIFGRSEEIVGILRLCVPCIILQCVNDQRDAQFL